MKPQRYGEYIKPITIKFPFFLKRRVKLFKQGLVDKRETIEEFRSRGRKVADCDYYIPPLDNENKEPYL